MKYKVIELTQTCGGCPSQWEGKLEDGTMIYIRYRWGCLDVSISEYPTDNIDDAVNGKSIFQKCIGDNYDGVLDNEKMFFVLKDIIECDIGVIN